ncbi:MAG: DciA family protein [Candidatus Kapaibacterium sp.]
MAYPRSLEAVIPELLKEFGLEKKARNYSVITGWAELVGEKIARAATAEKLEKGILSVRVKNPVWRFELQMQKAMILEKIAAEFGPGLVRDILWKV